MKLDTLNSKTPRLTVNQSNHKQSIDKMSEGEKNSSLKSSVVANSSQNQNVANLNNSPSNRKLEPKNLAKNMIVNIDSINNKSTSASPLIKGKKKKKLIKHCKDDPEPEVEEEISEKEEWLYKFNSDNEFYLGFYNKFYNGFKVSSNNKFTLSYKRQLSLAEKKKIHEEYLDSLGYDELNKLAELVNSKISKEDELKQVSA